MNRIIFGIIWSWMWLVVPLLQAQQTTEVYRIDGGAYVVTGGFIAEISTPLPNTNQTYIVIRFDHGAQEANLRILGEDYETVFLELEESGISDGLIVFSYPTLHPMYPLVTEPAQLEYRVQLGDASILMNGSISLIRPICCDLPHRFEHVEVHATILPGPPLDPAGIYDYQGFSPGGDLLVEGVLAMTNHHSPVEGTWKLSGHGAPVGIGPQIGMGQLAGTIQGQELHLDLNPGIADDNVYLHGVLADRTYEGEWNYATLLGYVTNGTFIAQKRDLRLEPPRYENQGLIIRHNLPPGMVCAIEFTETLGSDDWQEVFRFRSMDDSVAWIDENIPPTGRYYRLHVLDATGHESLADCARRLMADYLHTTVDAIEVLSVSAVNFPNSCCGCILPTVCASVITPGYTVLLQVGGDLLEVRTCGGPLILCGSGASIILGNCE